jgi:hypothetical protein
MEEKSPLHINEIGKRQPQNDGHNVCKETEFPENYRETVNRYPEKRHNGP